MFLEPQCSLPCQECLKFFVVVLCCGQCVVDYWRSDGLDAGKRVGDDVVLIRDVTYICRELRDIVEVAELPWRTLVPFLLEGVSDGFVIGEDDEMSG
jgi:hypothetical protein